MYILTCQHISTLLTPSVAGNTELSKSDDERQQMCRHIQPQSVVSRTTLRRKFYRFSSTSGSARTAVIFYVFGSIPSRVRTPSFDLSAFCGEENSPSSFCALLILVGGTFLISLFETKKKENDCARRRHPCRSFAPHEISLTTPSLKMQAFSRPY